MIQFYTENSLSRSLPLLKNLLCEKRENVLRPEYIVVQNMGMKNTLTRYLSESIGIFCNIEFLLPNRMTEKIFEYAGLSEGYKEKPDSVYLSWLIYELLKKQEFRSQLPQFLSEHPDPKTDFRNAEFIANLFDDYLLYRGLDLNTFFRRSGDSWQHRIFQLLREEFSFKHWGDFFQEFQEKRTALKENPKVPARILLFRLYRLPLYHLHVFKMFSEFCDLHWFHYSPSVHWWEHSSKNHSAAPEAHFEEYFGSGTENPFLHEDGKMLNAYFLSLMESKISEDYGAENFSEDFPEHLLGKIQKSIALDISPEKGEYDFEEDDFSVVVSKSPTIFREIETLRNFLCGKLRENPNLQPREILIIVQNLNEYAPFIKAIFENDSLQLPYFIEQRHDSDNFLTNSLPWLLDLLKSRFEKSSVFELYEFPEILKQFQIIPDEFFELCRLFDAAKIRWGIDSEHREESIKIDFSEFSWEWGLRRIALGFFMNSENNEIFRGHAPCEIRFGENRESFQKFLKLWKRLKAYATKNSHRSCFKDRDLVHWILWLRSLIADFFPPEFSKLNESFFNELEKLAAFARKSELKARIDYSGFRAFIETHLNSSQFSRRPIGENKICFADPLRMLGNEYSLIAFLGMNDAVFPKKNTVNGYHLMKQKPLPGDPNPHWEDRSVFLLHLMNAKDCLFVSFLRENAKETDEQRPFFIEEFIRRIDRGTDRTKFADRRFFVQSIHAFEEENYFPENPFRNVSPNDYSEISETPRPTIFFTGKPLNAELPWNLEHEDLIHGLANPAEHFLRKQFGLKYASDTEQVSIDDEVFSVMGLEKWFLKNRWKKEAGEGQSSENLKSIWTAKGLMPLFTAGESFWKSFEEENRPYEESLKNSSPLPESFLNIRLENCRLQGVLKNRSETGNSFWVFSRETAEHYIRCWVEHLMICAERKKETPVTSLLIREKERTIYSCAWNRVPNPEEALNFLTGIYRQILSHPIPFFKETAMLCNVKPGKKPPNKTDAEILAGAGADRDVNTPANRVCFGTDYVPGEETLKYQQMLLNAVFYNEFFIPDYTLEQNS